MTTSLTPALILAVCLALPCTAGTPSRALPAVVDGWVIERVAEAPEILYPTAIAAAPDGTLYLGSDPMDMPGPPTSPIDSVVAIKDGKIRTYADRLWSVMGLEWVDGTLFVVHSPFLSAFRDTDGDGKADWRVNLITGLGPQRPGFSGMNDHVASGIRLGMDGFLYIAVGDKGIPRGVARDGTTIQLRGRRRDPHPTRRHGPGGRLHRASATRSPWPSPRATRSSPTATTTTASDGPTA